MSPRTGRKAGYEFLEKFGRARSSGHRTAPWLLNNFEENVWKVQNSQKEPFDLDWGARMWDGSLLTAPQNERLLLSLKHLLIIGANGVNKEFAHLAPESRGMRFACTVKVIDYLLINAKRFSLIEFGLGALNGDDLKAILSTLASDAYSHRSIYNWSSRVAAFCKTQLDNLSTVEAEQIFAKYPAILEINDESEDGLDLNLTRADIPNARAALMKAGLYYGNNHSGFKVSTTSLSAILYPETIRGRSTAKPALDVLNFYPNEQIYNRELPAARVTTGESELLQTTLYFLFRYCLIHSSALASLNLPTPSDTDTIIDYIPKLRERTRFGGVPADNLLKLFRRSIEFHVEHGPAILRGYLKVAEHCHHNKTPMHSLKGEALENILGSELVDFGVKTIGLSCNYAGQNQTEQKGDRQTYYQNLRKNRGLVELVYVYLGSIQLTIGMLMARRVDEMVTLKAKSCLDESRSWLNFCLGKSTRRAWGIRLRESRPVDAIAVEMIEELQRFQDELSRIGVNKGLGDLFATPSIRGLKGLQNCSLHLYNRHLDYACDYFESDLNGNNERYYVRQHQLRRFFAILFFSTNSFGELDTLRWMLGHRDLEHVWNYLSECLDGNEIQRAGTQHFVSLIKNQRLENYKDLKELLEAEFGTTMLHLVDEEKIEDRLMALQEQGRAKIEPHFYKDEHGKAMKVLFILSDGHRELQVAEQTAS